MQLLKRKRTGDGQTNVARRLVGLYFHPFHPLLVLLPLFLPHNTMDA